MTTQHQVAAELRARCLTLTQEILFWQNLALSNERRRGLHLSQIQAIGVLLEELAARQQRLLEGFDAAMTSVAFARQRRTIEHELSYLHGVAAIFRYILAQRDDARYYRAILDAADLIAASCYLSCVSVAKTWGALQPECYREPPLCYFNAALSPTALGRGYTLGMFGFPLDGYREKQLPIPLISIPFHHASSIWMLCSIHHEVGHILDNDLHISAEMGQLLGAHLHAAGVAQSRIEQWSWWLPELIADAFGVLFGGAGFAYTLVKLLLLPDKIAATAALLELHPPPYLRLVLLANLLRVRGVPELVAAADMLLGQEASGYGEAEPYASYIGDCPTIAGFVLNEPLGTSLRGRRIHDFRDVVAANYDQVELLARFLWHGTRQAFTQAILDCYHLIPAAAQRAVWLAAQHTSEAALILQLEQIHQRTLALFRRSSVTYLDTVLDTELSPRRVEHLRHLAATLDFGGERHFHE